MELVASKSIPIYKLVVPANKRTKAIDLRIAVLKRCYRQSKRRAKMKQHNKVNSQSMENKASNLSVEIK